MHETTGPRLDLHFPAEAEADAIEFVRVEPEGDPPSILREQVLLHVPHDGDMVPREYLQGANREVSVDDFARDYVAERDWGASAVAERLAARMGLGGFWRVRVARVLMDYARFPGETRSDRGHLHRFALNYPFSAWLPRKKKRQVLETLYDRCSDVMEPAVVGKTVVIGIHTYDSHNESGTLRPDVSLITRPHGYQAESRMPIGVFDSLYPDLLGEYTADRILNDRISLTLEKARIRVAHNYPYLLPEGSIEVRAQVFLFFHFVRQAFTREYPESATDSSYVLVWQMLCDTNLRSVESESLRSHLHMYRQAPRGRRGIFKAAVQAYEQVAKFVHGSGVIDAYRFSANRPSSLALEVRKDLAWRFDDAGWPAGPVEGDVDRIAERIAAALVTYYEEDHGVWA